MSCAFAAGNCASMRDGTDRAQRPSGLYSTGTFQKHDMSVHFDMASPCRPRMLVQLPALWSFCRFNTNTGGTAGHPTAAGTTKAVFTPYMTFHTSYLPSPDRPPIDSLVPPQLRRYKQVTGRLLSDLFACIVHTST